MPRKKQDDALTPKERAAFFRKKKIEEGYVDLRMFVPGHLRDHLRKLVEKEISRLLKKDGE